MAVGTGQQRFFSVAVEALPFSTLRRRTRAGCRFSTRWTVVPLFLLDAVCIAISMAAAYQLRFILMKATLDYVSALVGVVLLAPVFLIIAFLVRRNPPRPAIHRRRVVGLYGQRFDAFKFRPMVPDADACLEAHPELKEEWERTGNIQDDLRVTRVGRFLRRHSLDELSQLFNVLRGEMSLVGPRMITPAEQTLPPLAAQSADGQAGADRPVAS